MYVCLLTVVFAIIFWCANSENFNTFKSYKDATIKPPQYGNIRKRPPSITEYLTKEQIQMVKIRNGPTDKTHSFNENWSGLRADQN